MHMGDGPYLALDLPKTMHSGPATASQGKVKVKALCNALCQGMFTHEIGT